MPAKNNQTHDGERGARNKVTSVERDGPCKSIVYDSPSFVPRAQQPTAEVARRQRERKGGFFSHVVPEGGRVRELVLSELPSTAFPTQIRTLPHFRHNRTLLPISRQLLGMATAASHRRLLHHALSPFASTLQL